MHIKALGQLADARHRLRPGIEANKIGPIRFLDSIEKGLVKLRRYALLMH